MALLTLGTIELAGRRFPQPQALLLLAYLSMEGRKERTYLAELFWPEAKRPLNNLSSALTRLRSVDASMIDADRYTVGAEVPTDVERFADHATTGRHQDALDFYRGRFLDGLPLDRLGLELEEWVMGQRSALAATARDCATRLAERAAHDGRIGEATGFAERAVVLGRDTSPEPTTLAALLPILRTGSSPLTAEVESDATDIGVETTAVPPRSREAGGKDQGSAGLPIHRDRFFFGREGELEQLDRLLSQPGIVAVTGFGGIGKTELARIALQARADDRPAHWVEVSLVDSMDRLFESIGRAVFPDEPAVTDVEGLATLIGHRPTLVGLDGLDDLTAGFTDLVELVDRCRGLTILVTSRVGVPIEAARTIVLAGLPILDASGGAGPALDLFSAWFARVAPTGTSLPAGDPAAVEICRLLDGHPLGIELIAGWLNTLTPEEIADGLAGRTADRGLASLADPAGLEAILDGTWHLLDDASRRTLARLSVVPGGFDRAVAERLGDGSLLTLRRLVDWSLVSRHGGEWYRCHPLVRGYARARLAELPGGTTEAEEVLCEIVIEAVSAASRADAFEAEPPSIGFEDPVAVLVATWELLLHGPKRSALADLVDPLDRALVRLGRQPTLRYLLTTTADKLDGEDVAPLRVRIEMHLVWLLIRLGDYSTAASMADRLLGWGGSTEPDLIIELTRARSAIDRTEGDVDRALGRLLPIRPLAAEVSERMLALIDNDIGICQMVLGLYPESRESYRSVLAWARREGSQPMITWTLLSLGIGHHDSGETLDSLAYLLEAKAIVTVQELAHIEPFVDVKLARAHLADGDHEAAAAIIDRARSRDEEIWEPWLAAEFDIQSAGVAAAFGRVDEQWRHLERGLATAVDLDDVPFVAKAFVATVDLGSRLPEVGRAAPGGADLMAAVAREGSGADYADRMAAQDLLDRIDGEASGEVRDKAIVDLIDEGFAYLRRGRLLTARGRRSDPT